MQFRGQGPPPVGVAFDCDLGTGIDDALALAMLYGLQGKGEMRVIATSVSRPNLNSAALCDAINRFYLGGPGPFGGNSPPVGLTLASRMAEDTPMVAKPLARQTAEGKPVFARSIVQLNDTADPLAVIRNALTAQFDGNAIVVLAGPATNLAGVLGMPGARELIARKVRYLAMAAGAFPEGGPEAAIKGDVAAARKVFAEWPVPIVVAGAEVGEALPFPGASIERDFAWSDAHPVADAYRANRAMPYDAPSGALTAVLYAVRPEEGYFKLSGPGTVTVTEDGRTRFTPAPGGKHRYLIADPAQKERVIQAFTEIASMKPVPRATRFRGPAAVQQKKQE